MQYNGNEIYATRYMKSLFLFGLRWIGYFRLYLTGVRWSLPVADLLYVGKSTNRKLALFGIKTIGDLARADEDVLNSHLGKMGSILWSFANGYDDSPVKLENTHAPIKSVGNSTTTPKDLVCDEDVKIVLYILAESVSASLVLIKTYPTKDKVATCVYGSTREKLQIESSYDMKD